MKVETPEKQSPTSAAKPARAKRKRRWLPRFVFLLLLLGVTGYFLPAILAQVLPNKQAMGWLSQGLPAQLQVGTAELAWESPVKLGGITVSSADGDSVATVENISSQQTLWNLVTGKEQPVALNLEGFRLSLTIPDSFGSTSQPDLARIVKGIQGFKLPRPAYPTVISISRGTIELRGDDKELLATWEPVDLKYEFTKNDAPAHTVQIHLRDNVSLPEMLHLNGVWKQVGSSPLQEELTFEGSGERISLQRLQPYVASLVGEGVLLGDLRVQTQGAFRRDASAGWALKLSADIRNSEFFQESAAPVRQVVWQLPTGQGVQLEVESTFDKSADKLQIPLLKVNAGEVGANLTGQISELSKEALVDLGGEVRIPGATALDILPQNLRDRIHVEGMTLSNIAFRGALKPRKGSPPAALGVDLGWQRIHAFGVELAPGTIRYTLVENMLRGEPQNVLLNGGQLKMLPDVSLNPAAPELIFHDGLMLDQVQLTEEVCRDWLRYISPTMANATATEGRFSLTTHDGRVPLLTLEAADLPGVVRIHEARVRPGPLAQEILGMVSQIQQLANRGAPNDLTNQTWMQIADEDVRFRLYQGRVYHERFRFQIGDVPAMTTGSVGLDNTLDLKLVISLPEKWTQNGGPVLQALRGEVIEVPIRGTMDRPVMDGRALADFGKRIGVRAGLGVLERILEGRGGR